MKSILFGLAIAGLSFIAPVPPAEALEATCTGDQYYVNCTASGYDYESGKYVNCYASGNPDFLQWTCSSY